MNNVNKLFVISTILVPLLLISLNYTAIHDFYTYSVPLNKVIVWDQEENQDLSQFMMIHQKQDSTCFTTPSMNYFCYEKPRFSNNTKEGISIVRSNTTGTFGELHAEPTDRGSSYFTMKNMTRINGDTVMITFADRDGYVYERHDKTAADFEFSKIVEKF